MCITLRYEQKLLDRPLELEFFVTQQTGGAVSTLYVDIAFFLLPLRFSQVFLDCSMKCACFEYRKICAIKDTFVSFKLSRELFQNISDCVPKVQSSSTSLWLYTHTRPNHRPPEYEAILLLGIAIFLSTAMFIAILISIAILQYLVFEYYLLQFLRIFCNTYCSLDCSMKREYFECRKICTIKDMFVRFKMSWELLHNISDYIPKVPSSSTSFVTIHTCPNHHPLE